VFFWWVEARGRSHSSFKAVCILEEKKKAHSHAFMISCFRGTEIELWKMREEDKRQKLFIYIR